MFKYYLVTQVSLFFVPSYIYACTLFTVSITRSPTSHSSHHRDKTEKAEPVCIIVHMLVR
jgi:hypothetical protein